MHARTVVRRAVCVAATAAACLAQAPAAHAGALLASVANTPNCSSQAVSQPFAPFLDYASYFQVPGGNFEAANHGWTLTGGAATVGGNEPWRVSSSSDANALALPGGSTATSPVVCVGIDSPTVRLFARKTGSDPLGLSVLLVQSVHEDAAGQLRNLPVATLTGGSSWTPTLSMPFLASLVSLLPGDQAPVELRFTAIGPATWQVDDVYVDPYHRCC